MNRRAQKAAAGAALGPDAEPIDDVTQPLIGPEGPTRPSAAEVEGWTRAVGLRTRTLSVLIVTALLAVPTALSVAISTSAAPQMRPASTRAGIDGPRTARAGEFAMAFVRAWLAPRTTDALDRFLAGTVVDVPARPAAISHVAVADIVPSRGDVLTVVVGADVDKTRRYFAVPLTVVGDATAALGLPAPVAAPVPGRARGVDYPSQIQPGGPVAEAATAFLAALLLGKGDITRYVTPGAKVAAIQPPPYAKAEVVTLRSGGAEPPRPADGIRIAVLATVELSDAARRRYTATYALAMSARGGRWEVAAIEPAPEVAPTSTPVTSTIPAPPR